MRNIACISLNLLLFFLSHFPFPPRLITSVQLIICNLTHAYLLFKGEEDAIKKTVAADTTWQKLQRAIFTECDTLLGRPPVERIQIGRRLLDKSREALRRVFFLSYAYRMTNKLNIFNGRRRKCWLFRDSVTGTLPIF